MKKLVNTLFISLLLVVACGGQKSTSSNTKTESEATTKRTFALEFLGEYLSGGKKQYLLPAIENIIKFNGAISRVTADGTNENLKLAYHPDDLASPYTMDMVFFAKNCGRFSCDVAMGMGKQGLEWKVLQKGK